MSSDALCGPYCTAGSRTVYVYQNEEKRQVTKEDRLVGQRFILQPHNDPKHQKKRTRWWLHMVEE